MIRNTIEAIDTPPQRGHYDTIMNSVPLISDLCTVETDHQSLLGVIITFVPAKF